MLRKLLLLQSILLKLSLSLHEITIYPNDTLSIPLEDLQVESSSEKFDTNVAAAIVQSGWIISGDIHADLQGLDKVNQVIKLSNEVMGFIHEESILTFLDVSGNPKKGKISNTPMKFTKAKGHQCHDGYYDLELNRVAYLCTESEKSNSVLFIIDVSSGDVMTKVHVSLPANFKIGLGLQLRFISSPILGNSDKSLVVFGTYDSDPFFSICTGIESVKGKDIQCNQYRAEQLDSISSLEENPSKDGILIAGKAKNNPGFQSLIECQATCETLNSAQGDTITIVRHTYRYQVLLQQDSTLQVCDYVSFGGRLVCKTEATFKLGIPFIIRQAEHSEKNKISMVFSRKDRGEYLTWGNINSISGRALVGEANTLGIMFNNSFIYQTPEEKGLLFKKFDIDPTLIVEASKLKDDKTQVVEIFEQGQKQVLTSVNILKLPSYQIDAHIPDLIPPIFATNKKVCLQRDAFTGFSVEFQFEKGRLISDFMDCQGQKGAIVAAGDDWVLTLQGKQLTLYNCQVDAAYNPKEKSSTRIFSCTQLEADNSALHLSSPSMEVIAANRIDSRGFYIGLADKKESEVLVVFDKIVRKHVVKGKLLEIHGVSSIDKELSNITPYFAIRTASSVSVLSFIANTQQLVHVNTLDVSCPVALEITNRQLRVAEGCKSNKIKFYNVPFDSNSTDSEIKLPTDITISGVCVLEYHVLVVHSPEAPKGATQPTSSQLRLYPKSLLGKLPALQPQYFPIPEPSAPIELVRCIPNKVGFMVLSKSSNQSLLFSYSRTASFLKEASQHSFLTRSGRLASWTDSQVGWFDQGTQVCIELENKGEKEETIKFNLTDMQNHTSKGKFMIEWVKEPQEIYLTKISHEVINMGVHDIENLVDIDGIVRSASVVEGGEESINVKPGLEVLKSFDSNSEDLNGKIFNDILLDGMWTFAVYYNQSDVKKATKIDVFKEEQFVYTLSLPISAKPGALGVYILNEKELHIFINGLDHTRSGLNSFFRLHYRDVTAVPIEEPLVDYLEAEEGFSGLRVRGDFLYLNSRSKVLPVKISSLDYQLPINIRSYDIDIAVHQDKRAIVSVKNYGIQISLLDSEGKISQQKHINQEKFILVSKPNCGKSNDQKFTCVFVSVGAYILEMEIAWTDLKETIYYHLINEGYELSEVKVAGEYIVGKMRGDEALNKSNEIQIWKVGSARGHGKLSYALPLVEVVSKNGIDIIPQPNFNFPLAVGQLTQDNPTPAFIVLGNPRASVALLMIKADHLKVDVISSEVNKKNTSIVLKGLSQKEMTLDYLQKREDNRPPSPSRRGPVSTAVWVTMIVLIVFSLIGIMLLLLYSINSHRAALYDNSIDDGSYSKADDTKPLEATQQMAHVEELPV